jgi:hypothetical protein
MSTEKYPLKFNFIRTAEVVEVGEVTVLIDDYTTEEHLQKLLQDEEFKTFRILTREYHDITTRFNIDDGDDDGGEELDIEVELEDEDFTDTSS